MDVVIISGLAFLASALTFFSGFGLGTILTPVFLVFFPPDMAIALTGIVHFFNNLFKISLVGRQASKEIVARFGIPAVVFAFIGAWCMLRLSHLDPLLSYTWWGNTFSLYPIKLIIAILLIFFALMDLLPSLKKIQFGKDKLVLGGALSGFFGGLSGNQGALRSAFLIKAGLTKEAFIGSAVVVSTLVDLSRLGIYATRFHNTGLMENLPMVTLATVSAIAGAWLGNRLLKKVTIHFLQVAVAVMLIILSIALGAGWV